MIGAAFAYSSDIMSSCVLSEWNLVFCLSRSARNSFSLKFTAWILSWNWSKNRRMLYFWMVRYQLSYELYFDILMLENWHLEHQLQEPFWVVASKINMQLIENVFKTIYLRAKNCQWSGVPPLKYKKPVIWNLQLLGVVWSVILLHYLLQKILNIIPFIKSFLLFYALKMLVYLCLYAFPNIWYSLL